MAINYIPEYLLNSQIIKTNYENVLNETGDFMQAVEDIYNQCFVDSATWGLDYWERELNVSNYPNDTFETRRARIKAKIQSSNVFTKNEAQSLTNQFAYSGKAQFEEVNNQYRFITRYFVDDLIDFYELKRAFHDVKPAHLYHIVGLILDTSLGIDNNTNAFQKLTMMKFGEGITITEQVFRYLIKMSFQIFLTSKYTVENTEALELNGVWLLDGSEELDGINNEGEIKYLRDSEKLTIKYKNGDIEEIEII